jgi:hypothetical protein
VTNANRGHLRREVEAFAEFVIEELLKRGLVGGLHFTGLFGEPGASLVKPNDGGFELIGLLLVWQKLYLQRQFHQRALCRSTFSISRKLSPRRLGDAKFLSTQARRLAMGGESFGENVEGRIDGVTDFEEVKKLLQ